MKSKVNLLLISRPGPASGFVKKKLRINLTGLHNVPAGISILKSVFEELAKSSQQHDVCMREVREYSLQNKFPNHKWNDFPKKSNIEHTFVLKNCCLRHFYYALLLQCVSAVCVVSSEASSDFKKHVRQIMDRIQDHLDSYSRNKFKSLESGQISRIFDL